jgi:predicted DNA-binding transcriptional regulator AlpA
MDTTPVDTEGASMKATSHADDELLTLAEAAAIVRVPEATLRYWRHLGEGPHSFRIGRTVRYWRSEVLSWLEAESKRNRSCAASRE